MATAVVITAALAGGLVHGRRDTVTVGDTAPVPTAVAIPTGPAPTTTLAPASDDLGARFTVPYVPPGLKADGPVREHVLRPPTDVFRSQPFHGAPSDAAPYLVVTTLRGPKASPTFDAKQAEAGAQVLTRAGRTLVVAPETFGGLTAMWLADPVVVVEVHGKHLDEEEVLRVITEVRLTP
jgi:hypothetical protein